MNDIAPHITRQRLLMEGYYTIDVTEPILRKYLLELAEYLNLRTYGEPIIFSPGGEGKAENQGYDAFLPLIDSGISAYIWSKDKFFSIIVYTCKSFDEKAALLFTQNFFEADSALESMRF